MWCISIPMAHGVSLLHAAKRRGKKVIMYGHSTREDFRKSFIGSNFFAPFVWKYLAQCM